MVNNKPLQDAHCPRPAGLEPQADSKNITRDRLCCTKQKSRQIAAEPDPSDP